MLSEIKRAWLQTAPALFLKYKILILEKTIIICNLNSKITRLSQYKSKLSLE